MRMLLLGATTFLLTLGLIGTVVLADDGGTIARLMGHDAYVAMVDHMRVVLGEDRADAMIASCEAAMASSGASMDRDGMWPMMNGIGAMKGSR